ncbi:hypothetical protein HPB49_014026 [Dermacentor silvarum]|uniref:Uncharacterized protein n=1 Tax=Dermacentor silvarum TaxID=543639 RepID=A0ACB8C416_DERSI|nr:hypothetical protein HPB49_014026 [Dermacentor silvarum]
MKPTLAESRDVPVGPRSYSQVLGAPPRPQPKEQSNVNPVTKDITDKTRYGVTIFTDRQSSIDNLKLAVASNAATNASLNFQVARKRRPHVRIMGVDPDVPASQLIEAINSGNPGLDLPRDSCRIRTSFRERGGNITHVLEIDPASLRHVLSRPRLMVGWTVVRAVEDLHVPVCTYCSTYGHARRACPDKDDPSKHGLAVLNDPLSPPTYETAYVSSWIDVTLATPAFLLSGGYSLEVSEDDSLSEHRYIQVSIGSDTRSRVKRLTRVGLHDLNASLVRDPWFRVVQGAVLRSPTALDLVLSKFHQIYGRAYKRNLRPDKSSDRSKPWWTPQLAAERKRVLAMRRRFQRCRDELLRQQFRSEYTAALALFRAHVKSAKEACVREHERACTRRSLFSQPYRSSFQTSRPPCQLPLLLRPNGEPTQSHLESAALLLTVQVPVEDVTIDTPYHAAVRQWVCSP